MVLTRAYPPGKKLVQEDLAKELGVSRGAVREAIFELKGMGLVDAQENRGGRIDPCCGEFLSEAFELREVLEGLVARRCCTRISRADLQKLADMAHQVYDHWMAGQAVEGATLDRQFHLALMRASSNNLQIQISRNFWFTTMVVRRKHPDPEHMLKQHLDIVKGIESGNPDAAEAAIREHIRSAQKLVAESLRLPPGELHWLVDPNSQTIQPPLAKPDHGK
jgi:DNA-binding GntR family transcriptional regulator